MHLSPYSIAHKHTNMYKKNTYAHINTQTQTHIYAYIYPHLNTHMYTYTHSTHTYTQICPHLEEYMVRGIGLALGLCLSMKPLVSSSPSLDTSYH